MRAPASARNRSDPAFGGGLTRSPRGARLPATLRILATICFDSVDYDDEHGYREVLVTLGPRGRLFVSQQHISTKTMPLSEAQLGALRHILQSVCDECRESPVGNLLENHLKVVALGRLLTSGFSVMEGSNVAGQGRVVSMTGNVVNSHLQERDHMPPALGSTKVKNSPDIRIWEPCRLVVELQVRSTLGSQSALFSDNLVDDLDRVIRGTADAFVLAADFALYESLRGLKADPRGRKAKHTEVLEAALPSRAALSGTVQSDPIPTAGGRFSCLGSRFMTRFGIERVVIAVWAAT